MLLANPSWGSWSTKDICTNLHSHDGDRDDDTNVCALNHPIANSQQYDLFFASLQMVITQTKAARRVVVTLVWSKVPALTKVVGLVFLSRGVVGLA